MKRINDDMHLAMSYDNLECFSTHGCVVVVSDCSVARPFLSNNKYIVQNFFIIETFFVDKLPKISINNLNQHTKYLIIANLFIKVLIKVLITNRACGHGRVWRRCGSKRGRVTLEHKM